VLRAVDALAIVDCWVGAGLIRNAVWDALHGVVSGKRLEGDVDVIFCDAREATLARDLAIEDHLIGDLSDVAWSVHNQARMSARNGDAPYKDVEDAIRHWSETATAIAARLNGGRVELLAPYGVEDLIQLVVRPTPAFAHKMEIYQARIAAKNWSARWPKLRIVGAQ
jgi:hypothetical protein